MEEINLNTPITPCPKGKGRKRIPQPEQHKRFLLKKARNTPKELPTYPTCGHRKTPGKPYECATLTMRQIKDFHCNLYKTWDKVKQDTMILKCCVGIKPNFVKDKENPKHKISIKYHVPDNCGKMIRVCKNAFMDITHLSRDRIERVMKNFLIKNELPKERRGGDRIGAKNDEKKNSIKAFIEKIHCAETHYCRSKTSQRKYLACDLNFKKLWMMYQSSARQNNKVNLSFFKYYVKRAYNLAFGTPQTDMCSFCLRTKEILTNQTLTREEKVKIITDHRIHKLKAKAFYTLLKKESEDTEVFSFDCQKNLPLPKLPDQSSYFSQQFNFYNFTVVSGTSTTLLNNSTVFSYVWTELDAPKDSNVISSAVFNMLNKHSFKPTTRLVRLFADGCGGQNKNVTMMCMIAIWVFRFAPNTIENVEFIFPIVGHSFIPPDRVFGLIEKDVKKRSCIVQPSEYEEIIKKHASIRYIERDWKILDFKSEAKKHFKVPASWHFQFNKSKRFIFEKKATNVIIRGEPNYYADVCVGKGVSKKGHKLQDISPSLVPTGKKIKGDKRSIARLLSTHYGERWKEMPELDFYKNAFALISSEENNLDVETTDDLLCGEGEDCTV